MILYHGTNIDFRQIRLDASRVGKDFGFGFYLTTDQYETGLFFQSPAYILDEYKTEISGNNRQSLCD